MAAITRAKTGNSKPRLVQQVEAAITPGKTAKANTSKPRAKTVASGRVDKKKTTTTATAAPKTTTKTKAAAAPAPKKKTPAKRVVDKVEGAVEKAVGEVGGKPGKKAAGTTKVRARTTRGRRSLA
ncbi:hypothetical protein BDV95DRAFT_590798 [Massariosphaeria phaeospora]|uniref:Uncharacterized protein n=1 Tax=Massariosphaeria phaeospora TaxID=100035 RepID=A0A7C8IHV0_9PLEO|nr:hypothetical protein BDV95DRAFT_590798 [Massariosphaeria phaeospora]